ncbi:hypothetical protein PMT_2256 [Prochlorococcus marinus str. MIT 9313]|uniref:Uncharacterized protein n=1 Tax=Prochlorococcus marinus (strain MIT 9313) TaxID=74547 RepID=Q7V3T4_PROMM|nr:hypothetical protein PMT_2256 [Prochlorococcus marinus str. MIT 9313]
MALGDLANQLILIFGISDHGGSCSKPFSVSNHDGLATLHYSDTTVRGSKVNANNLSHSCRPPKDLCLEQVHPRQ